MEFIMHVQIININKMYKVNKKEINVNLFINSIIKYNVTISLRKNPKQHLNLSLCFCF